MSLIKQIEQDFLLGFKAKDETVVSTLRLLKSELTKKAKEGKELDEAGVLQVLKSQIKQRKDSISEYEKAGRDDLVARERSELEILAGYLPEQLGEDKIRVIIDQIVARLDGADKSNFGKIMGLAMAEVKGAADGETVSRLVKEQLAKNV